MKLLVILGLFTISSKVISQTPYPRHLEEIAYDLHGNMLILYGGSQHKDGTWNEPSFVSKWDGKEWKQINTTDAGNRRAHALVYDSNQKTVVAIGGVMENSEKKNVELFDVWGLNGEGWKKLSNNCPVREPEAAYDATNKSILVYGHTGGYDKYELWEFKNGSWEKISSVGPKPNGPYEIAYHIARKSLIIPTDENDMLVLWEWRHNQWNKVECSTTCPDGRNRFGLAYHEEEKMLYLFGGRNSKSPFLNDFWKWDGTNWQQINTANTPLKRAAHLLEYANGKLILYGGTVERPDDKSKAGLSNEIWYFENNKWEKISGEWIQL